MGIDGRTGQRYSGIDTLLREVYLFRRWGGQCRSHDTVDTFRDTAADLLLGPAQYDSYAAGSLGLLKLDRGELEQALTFLRDAVRRFPGSAWVRYALARAEREVVAQRGQAETTDSNRGVLLWRQLGRIDERLHPLQSLGEGRTWLVQHDGAVVDQARGCFGSLGYWIQRVSRERADRRDVNTSEFVRWWAREVQVHVFGREQVHRSEDISTFGPIEDNVHSNSTWLDRLEEDWLYHFATA